MTKLSTVYSHDEIFIGGNLGVLPRTLSTSTKKFGGVTSVGLELNDSDTFVILTVNGTNKYLIPVTNFKLLIPE